MFDYGDERSLVLLPRTLRVPAFHWGIQLGCVYSMIPLGDLQAFKVVQLLEAKGPVLPAQFADLKTEADVLAFAEQYGLLFHRIGESMEPDPVKVDLFNAQLEQQFSGRAGPEVTYAGLSLMEPIETWLDEARCMAEAMALWTDLRASPAPDDWSTLNATINKKIREYLQLSLVSEGGSGAPTHLVIKPLHLLGVIWFLFAEMVAGSLRAGRCLKCSNWFWGNSKGAIARGKLFCSENCRKLYRYHEKKKREETQA